ncbi:hypothetical protein [Mucilaginibacter sp.]
MTDRGKRIFIILTIAVPFLLYCVYYYSMMIGNAPYKFSEFKSIQFRYGTGDTLLNQYNSVTGEYQYLNNRDSLIRTKAVLNRDDLLYLHRKAADLGFWNFPKDETGDTVAVQGRKVPRYYIQFNYQRKSKTVQYEPTFNGDEKLKDANQQLIKEIQKTLDAAESRAGK